MDLYFTPLVYKCSVLVSRSVMFNCSQPHEMQHARPACLSPTARVYWNPCPLRRWCHPTISSSVVPFPSCPQSFQASGSFQMSQPFASGGQSIGISASISVLPMNTQDLSPLGWTGWISLKYKGLSRVFSNTTVQKHWFFSAQIYFFFLYSFFYYFFIVVDFVIHWNETAMGLHVFPIPIPLPTSPSTRSL